MGRIRANLRQTTEDALVAGRFARGLPGFLRAPLTLEDARAILRRRLATRAPAFLDTVRRVSARRESPYARLLRHAGCELGDVERLVSEGGVEGALRRLLHEGVYLTVGELKGRRRLVRGTLEFDVEPAEVRNPKSVIHGLAQSGGSRGARTVVPIDLAFVRDHAVNTHLTLAAHGGDRWIHAHYGVPGGTAVTNLLELAKGGQPPTRWFTPVSPSAPGIHPRYRVGALVLRLLSRVSGVPLPSPEHVPLDDPLPIAQWLGEVLRAGDTPHLWTFASSAVLVAEAARAAGIDLAGAHFTAGGEPTTDARRAAIERSGAQVLPRFGTTETDIFAYACANPRAADDMHLLDDRHAVIQADGNDGAFPAGALLVTSLLPSAPLVLLNVSLGDRAEVSDRNCGCALEALGWRRHVWNARSFEKLTAGGTTILDCDLIEVLEQTLPTHFGGQATDYQLLEREDDVGRPVVRLLVHPNVGNVDEEALANVFLNAVGSGSEGERMLAIAWRDSRIFGIERRAPQRTPAGKIQHLHVQSDTRT